ncbi:MAG: HNH endonuclease, partial [Nitrososphaera sp.]
IRTGFKERLARKYGPVCSRYHGHGCGHAFPLYELTVDHVIPISRGGAVMDEDNMQLLCFSCHRRKTRRERRKP